MEVKTWTPEKVDQLRTLVNKGLTNYEIGKFYGTSCSAIEHVLSRHNITRLKLSNPTFNDLSIVDVLDKHLSGIKAYKVDKNFPKVKKGDTLVIHLTDFHSGKIVKDQTSNIIYDETIFKSRIDHLCFNILKILDNNISKGVPITDVVIISTGDLANGEDIYDTQAYEQELSPPNQVMLCVDVIVRLILSLIERKLPVRLYGVRGNHGRTGKDTDPASNWDSMIYKILELWLRISKLESKVQICYAEDTDFLTFNIRGHKYLARHKAPEQSDTPSGRVKFNTWAKEYDLHAIVYGHWHHFGITDVDGVTVFRGGSPVGGDGLSESMAKYSDPIQLVWGVTDERVQTFIYAIDLK